MLPQHLEIDKLDHRAVGGLQTDRAGFAGTQRLDPARDADAPAIARLQPGKIPLGSRRGQVVAGGTGKLQKLSRDLRTHRMQSRIARTRTAIPVTIKPGARRGTTQQQGPAKNIRGHPTKKTPAAKTQPSSSLPPRPTSSRTAGSSVPLQHLLKPAQSLIDVGFRHEHRMASKIAAILIQIVRDSFLRQHKIRAAIVRPFFIDVHNSRV